jgi:hypothetical protein
VVSLLVLPFAAVLPRCAAQTNNAQVERAEQTAAAGDLKIPHTAEDFSDLSLAKSALVARAPIVGQHDDEPQFTRDLIQVQWREGDPIDLYVIRPKGVTKPPVVLYLYGYPSETDRFRNNDYCNRVTYGGFAAVGFVSALTGHRYHTRPMKEWFVSELQESLVSSAHDVQMILDYLSTRNDLDMSHLGMFGAGSGGTIAILAASVDQRIKAIDLLDPWGDWPAWVAGSGVIPDEERSAYTKAEFLAWIAPFDPVHVLPAITDRHIRMQFVSDDPAVPADTFKKLAAAMPKNGMTVKYETGQELFSSVSGGRLFDWTKDQLRPADQTVQGVAATQKSTKALPPGNSND